MKEAIIELVSQISSSKEIIFNELRIKLSPHQWPINIYGISVYKERIALFDGDNWHELNEWDTNYDIVAGSVYQRLKSLQTQLKTA